MVPHGLKGIDALAAASCHSKGSDMLYSKGCRVVRARLDNLKIQSLCMLLFSNTEYF